MFSNHKVDKAKNIFKLSKRVIFLISGDFKPPLFLESSRVGDDISRAEQVKQWKGAPSPHHPLEPPPPSILNSGEFVT